MSRLAAQLWLLCSGGTGGDTQGVGGLCLPWGFHTVHKSTSGMSHNQTHWLPLNWPAGLPLAHLGASCPKTLPMQFTLALQLPPIVTRCLPHHSADTVTHSRLTTITIPIAVKIQLWACWTMGASQNDEALFPGTSPWHIGERCYTLGRFLFFSKLLVWESLLVSWAIFGVFQAPLVTGGIFPWKENAWKELTLNNTESKQVAVLQPQEVTHLDQQFLAQGPHLWRKNNK